MSKSKIKKLAAVVDMSDTKKKGHCIIAIIFLIVSILSMGLFLVAAAMVVDFLVGRTVTIGLFILLTIIAVSRLHKGKKDD